METLRLERGKAMADDKFCTADEAVDGCSNFLHFVNTTVPLAHEPG